MREIYPLAHELETRGTHHTLWLCGAATNEPLQYLHAFTDVTVYRRQRSAVENPRCVVPTAEEEEGGEEDGEGGEKDGEEGATGGGRRPGARGEVVGSEHRRASEWQMSLKTSSTTASSVATFTCAGRNTAGSSERTKDHYCDHQRHISSPLQKLSHHIGSRREQGALQACSRELCLRRRRTVQLVGNSHTCITPA